MTLPESWNTLFERELLKEMTEEGQLRNLEPGDQLIAAGQNIREIPIVTKGLLKVTREDDSHKELLLYYVGDNEGCALTFTCCMQIFPSEVSHIAETEVEVLTLPMYKMDEWMAKYPSWKSFVMTTMRERYQKLLQTIDQLVFQKLDERLIAFLKEKSKATNSTLINLSHEQIATEMASTREVISRLLKKLEQDGRVLLYRKQIKLMNTL